MLKTPTAMNICGKCSLRSACVSAQSYLRVTVSAILHTYKVIVRGVLQTPKAMAVMQDVEDKIMGLKAPNGTEQAPARTCHDFKVHNEELITGKSKWTRP